jgi:hypothetical protein
LIESRIDLYYILTYPKTEKYIALFPEGKYIPHGDSSILPGPSKSIGGPKTKDADSTRQELRSSIRHRIEHGILRAEAEGGDLGIEGEEDVGAGGVPEDGEKEKKKQDTAKKDLNPNGKRSMNSDQPEEEEEEQEEVAEKEKGEKEEEGTTNRKKAKENNKPIAVSLDMVEAHSAEGTTKREAVDESGPKETKKQKKDRKDLQRKLKKEAELKAKASADTQPNSTEDSAKSAASAEKSERPPASNWGEADEFFA